MSVRKQHWEQVYETKSPEQVSWTQVVPQTSLNFINKFNLPKSAAIIDIGGGDSLLVDFLLEEGFTDITVLDISEQSLERAKARIGEKADLVKWIVCDITEFKPERHYALWHDRATFHFLTTPGQIDTYVQIAAGAVDQYLIIATFSDNGPEKCSGLQIKQYSETDLQQTLAVNFRKIECLTEDHVTPFNTVQNFTFCSFEKV